jgi:hypothetical protein
MPEDSKNNLPLTIPAGPGKAKVTRAKHGIHSWVDSKRLPRGRSFAKTRRELGQLRTALIERRGGDSKITPEELILIDSVIEALGVQKLLGLYVKQYGIVDGQSAKRGRLELTPILSKSWVSYANVCRQAILALKEIGKGQQTGSQAEIEAILTSYSRQDEAEAAGGPAQGQGGGPFVATDDAGGPCSGKDGLSPGDQAKDVDDKDALSGGENQDNEGDKDEN